MTQHIFYAYMEHSDAHPEQFYDSGRIGAEEGPLAGIVLQSEPWHGLSLSWAR